MPSHIDNATLAALRSLDPQIIKDLVEANTDAVLGAALGLGWSPADAEELVQESFVAFLQSVQRFEGRSAVRTFLIGILYKKSLERGRKVRRELAMDPVDAVFEGRFGFGGIWTTFPKGPEEEALDGETAQMIEDCSAKLSEDQRMVFYLKEVQQEDTQSICNILEITPTHLGVLLFRARNNLRECLEKRWQSGKRLASRKVEKDAK